MTAQSSFSIVAPTGERIPVAVARKRVKNLNLRVRPDGSVALSAPVRASDARIRDFLDRHAAWVWKHVQRQRNLGGILGGTASAGDTDASVGSQAPVTHIPLWGVRMPVDEVLGDLAESLSGEALAQTIQARYKQEVARVLPGIAREAEARTGVTAARWSIRTMKTRWGSCTPKTAAIRINAQLAAYPPECLEMVVAHELVHLMEPSHNARFHALLDIYCPNNREASRLLKAGPVTLS